GVAGSRRRGLGGGRRLRGGGGLRDRVGLGSGRGFHRGRSLCGPFLAGLRRGGLGRLGRVLGLLRRLGLPGGLEEARDGKVGQGRARGTGSRALRFTAGRRFGRAAGERVLHRLVERGRPVGRGGLVEPRGRGGRGGRGLGESRQAALGALHGRRGRPGCVLRLARVG